MMNALMWIPIFLLANMIKGNTNIFGSNLGFGASAMI